MGSGRKPVPRHHSGEIPCRAAPARRWNWVFFLNILEVSQQGPWDAAKKSWPEENYCRLSGEINSVAQQQLTGRKERDYGQRDEWRGGVDWWEEEDIVGEKKNESDSTLSSSFGFFTVVNHWKTMTHKSRDDWQHTVTTCLFLLPFWHRSRSPAACVPPHLFVWVLKRLQSESGLIKPCNPTETLFIL